MKIKSMVEDRKVDFLEMKKGSWKRKWDNITGITGNEVKRNQI